MSSKKAKVVEIRSDAVLKDGRPDRIFCRVMIKRALELLSESDDLQGWLAGLFPGGGTIGIKVNSLSGRKMSTSPEASLALADLLVEAGQPENKILIWDRREDELKKAGYRLNTGKNGVQCFATDTAGAGFSSKLYSHGSIGSLVSEIQASLCDFMVNFAALKDHSLAGLSGTLKNNYGAIHNPNKYHESSCCPYQADLYSIDVFKNKQKLALFDAVDVQYNGGPGYIGRYIENYNSILVSTDTVAIDRVGIEIIDSLRTKYQIPRLKDSGREPIGVLDAGEKNLGIADLDLIEWVKEEI